MLETLLHMKEEAQKRVEEKNLVGALKVYRLLLESVPLDFNLRFEIADIFNAGGDKRSASAIYQAIAMHDIRAGDPLRGLVALKLLENLNVQTATLEDALATRYSKGSKELGRGVRSAPVDYEVPVRSDIDLDYEMDRKELVEGLARMASFTGNIKKYPSVVPPIPILSTLDLESFKKLCSFMQLKRFKDGQRIITEGEHGESLYLVARGEVLIHKKMEDKAEDLTLARLGTGSIFGEMSLISSEPRGASVSSSGACDVFELTRQNVEELSKKIPNVAGAMSRFTRERLISNLLATNPIFAPFGEDSRKQLLSRFTGHEVPNQTIFIEQGKPGLGLYLILQGSAEVLSWNNTEYVKVAELGPGDIAGEISLIHEEPATATVRTTSKSTLLFLAKELFNPLVEAVPELLAHFAKLANRRMADTENKLEEQRISSGAWIEEVDEVDEDEVDEISDDDLIMI